MKTKIVPSPQNVKASPGKFLSSTHKRLYAALGFSLCMFTPNIASAAYVWIDDLADTISAGTDVPGAIVQITNEGVGILGGADVHLEYLSADQNRPASGMAFIVNYNIFGLYPQHLSDTLSITISGHTPVGGAGDQNNVSVDMHFRSDSANDIPPPPLANAFNIFETGQYQLVNSGLNDLQVEFRSEVVPVPAAAWLLGSGLIGLAGIGRRKIAAKAA